MAKKKTPTKKRYPKGKGLPKKARQPLERIPKSTASTVWVLIGGKPAQREAVWVNAHVAGHFRSRPLRLVRTSGLHWKVWPEPVYPSKAAVLDSLREDTGKKGYIVTFGEEVKEVRLKVSPRGGHIWVNQDGVAVYYSEDDIHPTRRTAAKIALKELKQKHARLAGDLKKCNKQMADLRKAR